MRGVDLGKVGACGGGTWRDQGRGLGGRGRRDGGPWVHGLVVFGSASNRDCPHTSNGSSRPRPTWPSARGMRERSGWPNRWKRFPAASPTSTPGTRAVSPGPRCQPCAGGRELRPSLCAHRSITSTALTPPGVVARDRRCWPPSDRACCQTGCCITAGAHPYFVPLSTRARARQILGEGPLLAPEGDRCPRAGSVHGARAGQELHPDLPALPKLHQQSPHLRPSATRTP